MVPTLCRPSRTTVIPERPRYCSFFAQCRPLELYSWLKTLSPGQMINIVRRLFLARGCNDGLGTENKGGAQNRNERFPIYQEH